MEWEERFKKPRGHRRKHVPPLIKTHVSLTEEQAKLLRMWGRGDLSAGLRWLVNQAKKFVKKVQVETDRPHNSE